MGKQSGVWSGLRHEVAIIDERETRLRSAHRRARTATIAVAALAIAAASAVVDAQADTQRVTAAVRMPGAGFGEAVALDGRTMVVGAPGADEVHVFGYATGTGWVERQVLAPSTATGASRFGACVALDGDLLAVGAPDEDAVYVLTHQPDGTFAGMVRVTATTPRPGARFGFALTLRDGRLAVGAPWQDAQTGAVHLFDRGVDGTFGATAILRPAGVATGDSFGFAVAFDDDGSTLFATALQDDTGAVDAGAVYVLEEQSGAFVAVDKLVTPDAAATDRAGRALACSGDVLAVGVRNDDDGGRESGSVALFDRSGGGFAYAGKLLAPDRAEGDLFGHSVALLGDRLLVGAMGNDQSGFVLDVGRAYLFERDETGVFRFVSAFDSPALQSNGRFGSAVALGTRSLAIGGSGADGGAGEVFTSVEPARADPQQSSIAVSPAAIDVGHEAVVTVVVRDELGEPMDAGVSVAIETTLGQLVGSVVGEGEGRYTQHLSGDAAGTAEIGATVDGMPLETTVSLTIRDPRPVARVIGQRGDGSWMAFGAIQPAIDAAAGDGLVRILIAPGTYEEVLRLDHQSDLAVHGLASLGLVTVRGLRIARSRDLLVEGVHVQPGRCRAGRAGVTIRASRSVVLSSLFVDGTRGRHPAVLVRDGSRDVTIESCHVGDAGNDGVRVDGAVTGFVLRESTVTGSARSGVELGPRVRDALILHDALLDNGDRRGHGADGYGIVRRGGRHARPEDVTLIGNDVRGNHGRARRGRSTRDFGRYDLMIDAGDDQAVCGR